jgi:site-specific recombinase XerD
MSVKIRKFDKYYQFLNRRNLSTKDERVLAQQEKSQSPAFMTIEEIIEGMVHNIWFVIWKVCRAR